MSDIETEFFIYRNTGNSLCVSIKKVEGKDFAFSCKGKTLGEALGTRAKNGILDLSDLNLSISDEDKYDENTNKKTIFTMSTIPSNLNIILKKCNLQNADFNNVKLNCINFSGSDLSYANLSESTFDNAIFNNCKLDETNFNHSKIKNVLMQNAHGYSTKFVKAELSVSRENYTDPEWDFTRYIDVTKGCFFGEANWGSGDDFIKLDKNRMEELSSQSDVLLVHQCEVVYNFVKNHPYLIAGGYLTYLGKANGLIHGTENAITDVHGAVSQSFNIGVHVSSDFLKNHWFKSLTIPFSVMAAFAIDMTKTYANTKISKFFSQHISSKIFSKFSKADAKLTNIVDKMRKFFKHKYNTVIAASNSTNINQLKHIIKSLPNMNDKNKIIQDANDFIVTDKATANQAIQVLLRNGKINQVTIIEGPLNRNKNGNPPDKIIMFPQGEKICIWSKNQKTLDAVAVYDKHGKITKTHVFNNDKNYIFPSYGQAVSDFAFNISPYTQYENPIDRNRIIRVVDKYIMTTNSKINGINPVIDKIPFLKINYPKDHKIILTDHEFYVLNKDGKNDNPDDFGYGFYDDENKRIVFFKMEDGKPVGEPVESFESKDGIVAKPDFIPDSKKITP